MTSKHKPLTFRIECTQRRLFFINCDYLFFLIMFQTATFQNLTIFLFGFSNSFVKVCINLATMRLDFLIRLKCNLFLSHYIFVLVFKLSNRCVMQAIYVCILSKVMINLQPNVYFILCLIHFRLKHIRNCSTIVL